MANAMIPDMGQGTGSGSVAVTVSPDKLRTTAEGMSQVADDLERGPVLTLSTTRVMPCGLDDVSTGVAELFNHQINGGVASGYWAIRQAVAELRASAAAMTAAAQQYEAQNHTTADALRANQA